jgi:hypothetical protein
MSTQQVLNIPTAVSQATIEQWLKGLEQTTELAFFRRVGGRHASMLRALGKYIG